MTQSRSVKKAVQARTIEQLCYTVDRLKENIVELDMYLFFIEKVLITKGVATKEELDAIAKSVRALRVDDGAEPAQPISSVVVPDPEATEDSPVG